MVAKGWEGLGRSRDNLKKVTIFFFSFLGGFRFEEDWEGLGRVWKGQ